MGLKLTTKRDVWFFASAVALVCVSANFVIDTLSWSFVPPAHILIYGAIGAAVLSFPLAYMLGLQMLAVSRVTMDLEHAVQFDPLTGTLTRNTFLSRAKDLTKRPSVLIIVDIDNFKDFNDKHGHLAGDAALRQVAQKLTCCSRKSDIVARFGGEEFLILLPDTSLADGERIADELCALLRQTPVIVNGTPTIVTASFGVSQVHPSEAIDHALSRADGALYAAKRSGRDTVCIAA